MTASKALFGVLIGADVGGAVSSFMRFASGHQWINLGVGLFCLACGAVVVLIGRQTLGTQAETDRTKEETRQLEREAEQRWRQRGVDEAVLKAARGRDQ